MSKRKQEVMAAAKLPEAIETRLDEAEICLALNRSRETIRLRQKDGLFPPWGPDRRVSMLDIIRKLPESWERYGRAMVEAASLREALSHHNASVDESDARYKAARAAKAELDLAERRGELMPVSVHQATLTRVFDLLHAETADLIGNVALKAGLTDEQLDILEKERISLFSRMDAQLTAMSGSGCGQPAEVGDDQAEGK